MSVGVYAGAFAALVTLVVIARAMSSTGAGRDGIGYAGHAYVPGGPNAAVRAALAVLHLRGIVDVWRKGTVGNTTATAAVHDPLERALTTALYDAAGPNVLAGRPPVRHALGDLRSDVIRAGLLQPGWAWNAQRLAGLIAAGLAVTDLAASVSLRAVSWGPVGVGLGLGVGLWCLPRRTREGRRMLAKGRSVCPMPVTVAVRGQTPEEVVGMAAALYGRAALLVLMPRFATQGGLLDRRSPRDVVADSHLDSPNPDVFGA